MPAVRLLGRKWLIASDDFVFSSIVELLIRFIVWLVLMVLVVQILFPTTLSYPSPWLEYVRMYLVATLTFQGFHIIVLAALAYRSSKGSIMDVQSRHRVPGLLLWKLFLALIDIILNIMGTRWIFFEMITSPIHGTSSRILMQCILVFYWLVVVFTLIGIIIVYDPLGNVSNEDLQEAVNKARLESNSKGLWSWRFQWAFGCVKKDEHRKEIFEQVAALFYSLLRTTDLVPSDIVAGIVLLGARQEQVADTKLNQIRPKTADPNVCGRWMNLENAIHYMKLSEASYGCLIAMYQNLLTGPCNLMKNLTCCCCRQTNPRVSGDNCCLCNYAGVKLLSKYPDEHILYASFHNGVFEVPYYVLLDRERMEVVVVVRGTLSFKDIFTDCTAWSAKFEADVEGFPENTTAHMGFALSTAKVMERLLPVLEETFEEFPQYGLVVTGHSLGAGVAVLLGIKLRAKYRGVRVFAFSTPANLISREAAKFTEDFVMTVGLGDDVVMRLGVHSIEAFKEKILKAIHISKIPKYRILMSAFGYACFGIPIQNMESTYEELEEDSESQINISTVHSILTINATQCSSMPRLYPGGMILHMAKRKDYKNDSRATKPKYEIRWSSPEDYLEVEISPRMLMDHMPDKVIKAIETVLKEKDNYNDIIQLCITK